MTESSRPRRRRRGVLLVLVLVIVAGFTVSQVTGLPGGLPAVFGWQRTEYQATGPAATLSDVQDVEDLAARFNADEGVPRLIVLFAPT